VGNVAVYKKGTTDFFSQGLGLLSDVVSSTLTQTVSSTGNVEQKLEVEYPIDGYLVSELVEGAILRVSVSTDKSDYGVFEIVDTLKDDSGTITVYGDPYYNRILRMSFDNGGVFTKFSNVQSALNVAKQNITGFPADFNLTSNLSTSVDLSENTYDTFGTFLEALNSAVHGNIKYSLNSIQIYSAIGKDITDITLRDDMNTSSVKITTDFSGIINKVIPVLPVLDKDGNTTDQTKVGTIVTSKYSNQFLDYWAGKVIRFDTQDLANTYFDRTNADRPVHTVDVNPIGLDDDFSTINIFDTIELYSTRLDYTDKLRVSERVFDTLSENVTSFKLGSSSVNIFNQINEQNNEIFNNIVKLTNAAISANGKGIDYFGQAKPSSPKEGDTWFWDDGTDFGIKQYTNGEWVDLAGSNTAEKIATAVTDAVTQAKAYSDQLVATNREQVNAVLDDVKAKQADLTAQQAELDTKAQGYANKALADAKADTLATATQTAKDASDALATAKADLTTSLNKEVTDRANAVTALDTKAKVYADTAKTDAINVATTADGVINKKIDDTASSITSTISQNKTDADGKITTAQSTAQQALDGLSTKVSQTVYDAKTGQLQTDLNTTTTTANQAKTDIVAIKSKNDSQDARMTTIESDANGTKTTVSNLQTDLGKANGSITTLQQRADGFDATVTKVNNLSVGDRNYILDTANSKTQTSNGNDNQDLYNQAIFYSPIKNWGIANGDYIISFDWALKTALSSDMQASIFFNQSPWQPQSFTVKTGQLTGHVDLKFKLYQGILTATNDVTSLTFRIMSQMASGNAITYSNLFMKSGTINTTWTPAPEDLSSATAKAQLTADQATLSINNYKSDADGRISKAQADIIVNANAITTKVSQSDYNAKTGDLTTKVNTAQSTADSATSTIGAYKTSNDARVASAESKITANATAITQKVSQTDYDQKTGELSGKISEVSQTAGKISQSVADVTTQVNNLQQVNLINNSDFRPDLSGWSVQNPLSGTVTTGDYDYAGNVMVLNNTAGGMLRVNSVPITLTGNTTVSYTFNYYIFGLPAGGAVYSQLTYLDSSMKEINSSYPGGINLATTPVGSWKKRTVSNLGIIPPTGATYIVFSFDVRGAGTKAGINRPILVKGGTVGDYVPGQYTNNDKISTVSQTVDSISSIVSDPTTGLTKRVQTAEGTLSQVKGIDIPNLQKATYWQPYGSLDLNTYKTQGSYYFNSTTVKPNGPTTSTDWMYLQVEVANSDKVTQIAWYDKTTSAKITYKRQYVAGNWSPWYANDNDSVTSISQTNGAIQQEVKDRTNGDTNTLTSAKNFTTSQITSYDQGIQSQFTQTASGIIAQVNAINMVVNSEFDPIDEGWYTIGTTAGNPLGVKEAPGTLTPSFGDWDVVEGSQLITYNSRTWYATEPKQATSGVQYSASIIAGRTGASTQIAFDLRIAWLDADKKLIGYATSGNPINTASYVGIKQITLENQTSPANTKFVSLAIAHSGAVTGGSDIIGRPMLNRGSKIGTYAPTYGSTYTSTQLALLKDNWSIGISDNTGAIASGIAGDPSAMTVISPRVIIASPQTQITGTAWIKTAMIADSQISTAKIGDLAVTSAKISNLDVNKITGNVSSFIQSNWNGKYTSTSIDSSGMSINGGSTTTKFDTSGAHYSNSSGISATYSFGKWSDQSGRATSSTGLYLGATGSENAFINILGTNGSAALVLAGSAMDYGANLNIMQGALNSYVNVNIRTQLHFKGNKYNSPSYIEINESNRTFNFWTGGGSVGGGNYFYFNQNVISAGTFSSTSVLSKKNVKSVYDEDALGEIAKTQLVNFEYKNRIGQNHVSPIIDDVNSEKEYYIPKTILGQDNEYVDMYSMISMAWRAIQQLNEKIGEK